MQRGRVVGCEGAQRVLNSVAELAEHVVVDVLRHLRDEEHADAFGTDQAHGLRDRLDERLRRPVEQQVRLVEEEHELRLRQIADLGQRMEQLGQHPHQRGREQLRLVLHRRQLEARDDAATVGRRPHEVGDLEHRLAKELVAAAVLEADKRAQQDTDGLRREAADARQLGLPVVRGEKCK